MFGCSTSCAIEALFLVYNLCCIYQLLDRFFRMDVGKFCKWEFTQHPSFIPFLNHHHHPQHPSPSPRHRLLVVAHQVNECHGHPPPQAHGHP